MYGYNRWIQDMEKSIHNRTVLEDLTYIDLDFTRFFYSFENPMVDFENKYYLNGTLKKLSRVC